MQESALTERSMIQPEKKPIFDISREKILARSTDKIGRLFLEKKFYSNRWKTEIGKPYSKEEGKTIYEVNIEERDIKKPSRLTLKYEKPSSARLDKRELTTIQLNIDEATKIGLRKNQNGKWEYFRDVMRRQSTQLSSKEISLLNRHLLELKLSLNWERIIDILDPISTLKTITPALITAATVVGGVYINQNIGAINTRISDYLLKGNATQQEDHTIVKVKEKKPSFELNKLSDNDEEMFKEESKKIITVNNKGKRVMVEGGMYRPELWQNTLGLIQDLNTTSWLCSQPQLGNGVDFSNTVGKYLLSDKDNNDRYLWRTYVDGKPENRLVKPLWNMLKTIRGEKNTQSQKNYFRILDAFQHYKGQSVATPEKIMTQLGKDGKIDFINGNDIWKNYWEVGPENFNKGPIKGFWATADTIFPGEILVTGDGQTGIIMNITADLRVSVLVIDSKGHSRRIVYDASNPFPDSALAFGYTNK